MTLPTAVWAALGLDAAAVEARARFLAGYANLLLPRFTPDQLMGLLPDISAVQGRQAVLKVVRDGEVSTEDLRRRLSEQSAGGGRPPWVRPAEVADAWRECAIARLLLNPVTGKRALLRAADSYLRLGLPFGDFLGVSATGARGSIAPAAEELRSLLTGSPATPVPDVETHFDRQLAVQAPAQQVALLLTAVADLNEVFDGDELRALLADAPQIRGPAPVGATGTALADWWTAGRALARLATDGAAPRLTLVRFISETAFAHRRLLRTAQLDEFHWRRARAPVELVDLYLAGLVAITVRTLRRAGLPPLQLAEDFAGLPSLAQVSVIVGIQLAEQDGPPDWRRTYGPMRPRPSDRTGDGRRRADTRTEQ
ncbi:hypothetical protein [Verrucosispora sp. WMMC514]|uniref:hypothetical protein n=1 Tax=Verrucosispora sp. WMMC514 TaxID=3015156 RepID=UPI00248C6704|nr:hypothetical protein [Verrucosispora sp. WMMC514]WBB91429.1 hypothetical protein O7597_31480 [Verrucosispora sp. WMMC514]